MKKKPTSLYRVIIFQGKMVGIKDKSYSSKHAHTWVIMKAILPVFKMLYCYYGTYLEIYQ